LQASSSVLIDPGLSEQEKLTREVQGLFLAKLNTRVESHSQDLFETGVLDSATMVRLLLHIEEHFGIRLPIEEVGADSLRSVDSIARLVAGRRPAPAAPTAVAGESSGGGDDTIAAIRVLFLEKMAIRIESVDADLFQTGVFDSMTLVEFILHLEERFELRFPMEDLELDSVLSVTRLAEMVRNGKLAAAGDRF
jgi:acyl carrier protein